jgi:hypothetical protein
VSQAPEPPFLESFPHLSEYLFKEPTSPYYFGLGLTPIGVLKDKVMLEANFFQIHYIDETMNWEIFSASFGNTVAQTGLYQSNHFIFRSSPKFFIGSVVSVGPLVGYEFVSFPNVTARLYKAPYIAPHEPFSSRGMIYGFMISQTFKYKSGHLQVNEVVFKETYSVKETDQHWMYLFDQPELQANPDKIGPSTIMKVEISYLF